MRNDAIIQSIQCLLYRYQTENAKPSHNKEDLSSLHYLIGQCIRQYDIPSGNRHISKGAHDRWEEISNEKIENYHYRDIVICDKLTVNTEYELFKGANGNGDKTLFTRNYPFIFRDMFHEDHVIPVALIWEKLEKLDDLSYENIKEILNMMHICVILKEEDRRIGRTASRNLVFDDVINNVYKTHGVELHNPSKT